MTSFNKLGLPDIILDSLKKINFTNPTPIQEQAIPAALDGNDILGSAQTGTGKTAAFALPMLAHLLNSESSAALVLLPTRELARQVCEAAQKFIGPKSGLHTALLIGGEAMPKQLRQLKYRPRLIVGTPGRINDHLLRRSLKLNHCDFLVLDETDRMLDMGFGIQLEQICRHLPEQRQTLMFSATLPGNIVSLSQKYLKNPVRIAIGSTQTAAPKIKQEIVKTNAAQKYDELTAQLAARSGSILIFVKTKFGAERLAGKLNKLSLTACAIHGDLKQRLREKVISDFRKQKNRILVATDIAARGLDIPHIQHVINYDIPQCPEDYIHRIGRTARAGAEGCAVNIITAADAAKWKAIHKLMHAAGNDDTLALNKERQHRKRHSGNFRRGNLRANRCTQHAA